jgi:DNA invertase Pin-like site-specific DNA recombinase
MMQMGGAFAEFERAMLRERTTLYRMIKRRDGRHPDESKRPQLPCHWDHHIFAERRQA